MLIQIYQVIALLPIQDSMLHQGLECSKLTSVRGLLGSCLSFVDCSGMFTPCSLLVTLLVLQFNQVYKIVYLHLTGMCFRCANTEVSLRLLCNQNSSNKCNFDILEICCSILPINQAILPIK